MSRELSFVASRPLRCWVCGILIVKSGFVSPYSTKPALLQDIKTHVLANNIARFRLTPCLPSDLNYELKVEVLRRKGGEKEVAAKSTGGLSAVLMSKCLGRLAGYGCDKRWAAKMKDFSTGWPMWADLGFFQGSLNSRFVNRAVGVEWESQVIPFYGGYNE